MEEPVGTNPSSGKDWNDIGQSEFNEMVTPKEDVVKDSLQNKETSLDIEDQNKSTERAEDVSIEEMEANTSGENLEEERSMEADVEEKTSNEIDMDSTQPSQEDVERLSTNEQSQMDKMREADGDGNVTALPVENAERQNTMENNPDEKGENDSSLMDTNPAIDDDFGSTNDETANDSTEMNSLESNKADGKDSNDRNNKDETISQSEEGNLNLTREDVSTVTQSKQQDERTEVGDSEDTDDLLADHSQQDAESAADHSAEALQSKNENETYIDSENKHSDCNTTMENDSASPEQTTIGEPSMENSLTENLDEVDETLQQSENTATTAESGYAIKTIITWAIKAERQCKQCKQMRICRFRLKNPEQSENEYVCDQECCEALISSNAGKYFMRRRKFLVEERLPEANDSLKSKDLVQRCQRCQESRPYQYSFKQDEETFYVCSKECFTEMCDEEPDMFKMKRLSWRGRNTIGSNESLDRNDTPSNTERTNSNIILRTTEEAEAARRDRALSFVRRCAECQAEICLDGKTLIWETMDFCDYNCLEKHQQTIGSHCGMCEGDVPFSALGKYCVRFGFNIRQFCCASCLNDFKKTLKTCACCQCDISKEKEGFLATVGKSDQFRDFCSQTCMRRYESMTFPKKTMQTNVCGVCNNNKPIRVELSLDEKDYTFCSNPCFSAFKFVNNIVADQCGMCCKYFERKSNDCYTIHIKRRSKVFCSQVCFNVFMVVHRYIISCQCCKVKKYNFDMIIRQDEGQDNIICSLNCLSKINESIKDPVHSLIKCDYCQNTTSAQYQLSMSDDSFRYFCTYQCVMQFQGKFSFGRSSMDNSLKSQKSNEAGGEGGGGPFPNGIPKRVKYKGDQQSLTTSTTMKTTSVRKSGPEKRDMNRSPAASVSPSFSATETDNSVSGMELRRTRNRSRKLDSPTMVSASTATPAAVDSGGGATRGRPRKTVSSKESPSPSPPHTRNIRNVSSMDSTVQDKEQYCDGEPQSGTKIIVMPSYPAVMRNVQTNCKPQTSSMGVQCEPQTRSIGVQTEKDYSNKVLIPVPVPVYVPVPMYMYSLPFPVPLPFPLPIPVPIFIPTTRNSAKGIMKEIKKIQDKMPADPYEAELLMMAEMVAEEKHETESSSEDETKNDSTTTNLQFNNNSNNNNVQSLQTANNNSYGEDVVQMALKMASVDYDPQSMNTVDLESAMTVNTITNLSTNLLPQSADRMNLLGAEGGELQLLDSRNSELVRKRGMTSPEEENARALLLKRSRVLGPDGNMLVTDQPGQQMLQIPEKPDANMCLKYTFGVNAWKQWVVTKNVDLEKSTPRRRPFKTELLQMTTDELNHTLCLFVKEVRKPNGTEYAPDTIYYLVLGIQQYLYENGRIDNIFTDPYYEPFTKCLDDVAKKFSVLYNDSQYIVTRVEEEHLWECKQLGAHSPHVLLSTLMFFNTKHFNLTTPEEHMQLSFSHIMKHWKRNMQNSKVSSSGTRNVLLRFYPPQSVLEVNTRKKKVYEQQENEENPLRCPVRLYEFYLSKCPESVKTRNDLFYLQPERSCVPDSPVWYSTQQLSKESLQKMLHRVKMVKEINIALLTS